MKKKHSIKGEGHLFPGRKKWQPFITKVMRWTFIITCILCCSAFTLPVSSVAGQPLLERKVTLHLEDVPLKEALDKLAETSGVPIMYGGGIAKDPARITLKVKKQTLKQALETLFNSRPYDYKVMGDEIIIRDKPAPNKVPDPEPRQGHVPGQQPGLLMGVVTDTLGLPLPGVAVYIKATSRGTTTNLQGEYELQNVPPDATVVFRMIGFQTLEVSVEGKDMINVILHVQTTRLDEVVLSTGYQQIPKERATGSFVNVSNELINRQVSIDIISRLDGIVPSLLFDKRNGDQQKFSIRGRSTIMANDDPLIVVDNFPFDGDINNINPNDIESITILRDASAASIWGVRAGNGVIVITTKKGAKNQPLRVEFNSNVTIGNKPDLFYNPGFLKASEYIDAERMLFAEGFYDGDLDNTNTYPIVSPVVEILDRERNGDISGSEADARLNGLRNKDVRNDLKKHFYRQSINRQYSLNINGGSDKAAYMFSVGYDDNLSNVMGNEYSRITLNTYNTYQPIKNLEITAGLAFTQSSNEVIPFSPNSIKVSGTKSLYPYAQLADEQSNPLPVANNYRLSYIETLQNTMLLDWRYFPLEEVNLANNTSKLFYTRVNPGLKYTFIPGLNVELRYQYEKSINRLKNIRSEESYFVRDLINKFSQLSENNIERPIPLGSILDQTTTESTGHTFRAQVNFNKLFSNEHEVAAIAGVEVKELRSEVTDNRFYGYDEELATVNSAVNYTQFYPHVISGGGRIPYVGSVHFLTDRYLSYFSNASYTFKARYSLALSGRIDKSNLFGVKTNQKSVPLWSFGTSWNIGREPFYKSNWLPYLKIRATYGYNGNVDKNITAFRTGRYATDFYTGSSYIRIVNPGNPELRWEKIGILNIGLDFKTANDIITGSIEYYRKKSEDLIGDALIDPTIGILDAMSLPVVRGNFADMKGEGLDIQFTTKNINRGLKWQSSVFFSYNTDKVTEYNALSTANSYLTFGNGLNSGASLIYPTLGRPVFSIYSYKWAGLDPETGDPLGYDADGNSSSDYASLNSVQPEELVYNGPALPRYFGAVRNTFSWKNLSLSFNISYKFGYYFRRASINYNDLFNNWSGHKDYSMRWQNPGDEQFTSVPSVPTLPISVNRDNFYRYSEALVEKGDHIRLQDIQLSFNMDNRLWKKMPLDTLQFYVYANNLGILWRSNKLGLDPDITGSVMPSPFSLSFGVRGTF